MKKYVKMIVIAIVVIWFIFIVFDCNRLNTSNKNLKPFITMSKEYKDGSRYGIEHIGLGYSVKHYRIANTCGYGTVVNLFYIIPLPYFEAQ